MKKTYNQSRIVQFHHDSTFAENILSPSNKGNKIVLQIETVEHPKFDFIAEIITTEDYEKVLDEDGYKKGLQKAIAIIDMELEFARRVNPQMAAGMVKIKENIEKELNK